MKRRHLWLLLLAAGPLAAMPDADPLPTPSDLPSAAVAIGLLRQDPAVQEALANVSGASHVAGMLRASPYEWTLRGTGQQRRYEIGPASREWSAQLERSVRLPGKKALDRQLGEMEIALADAHLNEAVHEAARSLLELWMDWLQSGRMQALLAEQAQFAESNLRAVQARQRAGDASTLEVNVAAGDAAQVQQRLAAARAEADKARARLEIRFPAVPANAPMLSQPQPVSQGAPAWRERILATSDPLRQADLELRKAEQQASRVRADRLPDPTFGVFTASEVFGRERVIGVSVSVPLPGGYRRERLGQALSGIEAAAAARDRVRRTIEAEISTAYTDASSNHARWQLAEQGARQAADTARLTQRAYTLGEADVQTLLLARQQSLEVAQAALEAQVAALRARYRLLIDAHRIWGLEHE